MSKRTIFLLVLAMLAVVSSVFAQDTMEKVYPSQFATVAEYVDAGGSDIMSFQEAPMLGEMVEAGNLPPVEDRLPAEPAIVEPFESVGVYGGELAGPSTNPTCCGWDAIEMRLQKLLTIDTDLTTIIPNIAKSYEVSDDSTVYTITLREGHKWSDGEPFTTEDFRFYFEDVLGNEELTPVPGGPWAVDNVLPEIEYINETTIQFTYEEPYPALLVAIASEVGNRGFRPAHYFQQFHIEYNPDANELAEAEGFEDWVQMFNAKMTPYNFTWNLGAETDAYAPTLNTFVFASEDTFGNKTYERNPYFFKVDIEGNQLPYVDSLRRILVEDLEVQDLKALAGEYSHFGWGALNSFPTYRENEEAGGYRVALAEYSRGNEYAISFNFTTPNEDLREIFWDIRFRQAMSVAIDREEINQLVYFGLATPSQAAPVPSSPFYQDWMGDYFAQYDPDMANQLLDEMGLDQRDGEGFRTLPNGETLFLNFQVSVPEQAWEQIGELITSYWNDVGVKTSYKLIEIGLYNEIRDGNQHDLAGWALDVDDIGDFSNDLGNLRPFWGSRANAHPWDDWFETNGEDGEEPPEEIKALDALADELLAQPFGSEAYLTIGEEFYDAAFRNLYMIGTIQRPPQPLLFKTNLMNTPPNDTTAQWSWSYRQWVMFLPEQWYFAPDS